MSKKKTNPEKLNVLLGVSGGVAAYKAVYLASRLNQSGRAIKTIMTDNACKLIGPRSFQAVTCSEVFTSLWDNPTGYNISHINLSNWADIVVVAPATANIIGKIANGICDDLLSTVLCTCRERPVLLAPAMNSNMWNNPVVQNNIEIIKKTGFELIGPEKGCLACGTEGVGRMSEPEDILKQIGKIAAKTKRKRN